MELKNWITRITGISILLIMMVIIVFVIVYKENQKNKYTYVIDDKFYKSNNCYIDKSDYRVCETKKGIIRVEMFYE